MPDIRKEKKNVIVLSIIWAVSLFFYSIIFFVWYFFAYFVPSALAIIETGYPLDEFTTPVWVNAAVILILFIPLAAIIHHKTKIAQMKVMRIVSKVVLIVLGCYTPISVIYFTLFMHMF